MKRFNMFVAGFSACATLVNARDGNWEWVALNAFFCVLNLWLALRKEAT